MNKLLEESWLGKTYNAQVIITGGLGVIGRTLIKVLLEGTEARLIVIDVKKDLTSEENEFLKTGGSRLVYHSSDGTNMKEAGALLKEIGTSEALVHLAGVFENDLLAKDIESKEAIYNRAIASNLTNAYNLAEAFVKNLPSPVGMEKQQPGTAVKESNSLAGKYRMIFTSSLSFRRGAFEHAAYSAAKGGIVGLVRAYSKRYAPEVLVNAVAPGIIDSNMASPVIRSRGEALRQQIPLRRWGDPLDVVLPICFFLSTASSYITGQTLNIDGGIVNG